jgi:Leucine-rich repeat (LRR) protein
VRLLAAHDHETSAFAELYTLPKLDVLDVFFNKVETLDLGLTKLTSLRALDLGSNDIVTVPPQLGLMTSLR